MDWKALTAQAAPVVVTVRVELPYLSDEPVNEGEQPKPRAIVIPLGTLSYGEWMKAEAMTPEPAIPQTLAGPGNSKLPNRDDVKYRAALSDATEKRAYLRLAMALEKGGMAIPGSSLEAKAAIVRDELDAGVANALLTFLATAAMNGKATAEAAADTFRR